MKRIPLTIIFALAVLTIDLLPAGVVPGHWEKVKTLKRDAAIIVFLQEGDRLECTYQETTDEQLVVATADQPDLALPKATIKKVTGTQLINDSTRNGTWIGAGIGFGGGFAGMVAVEKAKTASGYSFAEENVGYALAGGLVGAAAGAVLGRIIDGKTKSPEVLYQAP
jgi:hypothetical protein